MHKPITETAEQAAGTSGAKVQGKTLASKQSGDRAVFFLLFFLFAGL